MATNLLKRINIGKDTETKLVQVGINSVEKLVEAGSEKAFLKIQTIDPGACINLLYGLECAVQEIKPKELSPDRKQELKQFFMLAKK